MTHNPRDSGTDVFRQQPDFSLVLGGPLYQLLRRARLSDDTTAMLRRRIVLVVLICWVPLLLLSTWQGQLFAGSVAVPFLSDIEVHVRLLVVVPLLVGAELVVHRRMRLVVTQFIERGLVADDDIPKFQNIIKAAMRLRNSVTAEVLMIFAVYGVGVLLIWQHYMVIDANSWHASHTDGVLHLSPAGMWYGYVSVPVFQFLLLRWYFRIGVWALFLWRVSRLTLRLNSTHPDRAGGLGFLSGTVYAFVPLLVAHGAMLAGLIASRVFFAGETLVDFKLEIAAMVVFLVVLVEAPLMVFVPQLELAKRAGMRDYGLIAQKYARAFEDKWFHGGASTGDALLGSADVQSLADLAGAYETVQSMRITLLSRDAIITFAGAIVAPIVPLALTMMPIEELLKKLASILL